MAKSPSQPKSVNQQNAGRAARATQGRPWYIATMVLIVLCYSLLYFRFGEFIALNQGCGWDGVGYKDLVLMWDTQAKTDAYKAQRILPSLNVRLIMKSAERYYGGLGLALGQRFFDWFYQGKIPYSGKGVADISRESIVAYFYIHYSVIVLLLAALMWGLTAHQVGLSAPMRWLGFVGLFGNFALMKMSLYYPTLTDTTAFMLSLVMLYGYLRRWSWLVLMAGFAGLFTWPTAFYVACVLILFPRERVTGDVPDHNPNTDESKASLLLSLAIAFVAVSLGAFYVYFSSVRFPAVEPTALSVAGLGLIALGVVVFLAARPFAAKAVISADRAAFVRYAVGKDALPGLVLRAFTLIFVWGLALFLRMQITDSSMPSPMNAELFLGGSFVTVAGKPMLSLVSASVYFGPVLLLGLLCLSQTVGASWRLGYGFFILMFGVILLGTIVTESRQLINFLPFFVVALSLGLQTRLSKAQGWIMLGVICALSIAASKIWLPLNFDGMQQYVMTGGTYTTFPIQRYFMNHGPWMTWESYWWQLCAVGACTGVLWFMLWAFARNGAAELSLNVRK